MSKDFFKVKKGLHIKPTDPTTLTDLEDGDIIVDSTDNQLKKYSEEDGEFSTISGSGGTVANFFADFDKLTPTLSNASVADDSVTFLPIDDNKKSKKATFSAAGSVLYEVASEADLEGNQGLMTVWIKTSLNSVTVSTTTDGVVQSTLSVLGTNKWKQYEIPFVVGGTDQGLIVEAGEAGDVFIDEPFVGLAPAGYIQQVGQAQFVGDINFNSTNCLWILNSGTTFQSFPVDSDCVYQTRGNVLQPDTKIPAIKIPNVRTDGYYQVVFNGVFGITSSGADDICNFNLSDTTSLNPNGGFAYTQSQGTLTNSDNRFANEITGQFRFTTNGDKTIQILAKPNASGDSCLIAADNPAYGGTISVHFFPDASSTVVTQNTELTAQTANEFSAKIGTSGIVESENYSFINGNATQPDGDGFYDYSFNSNIFTQAPSCSCIANNGNTTQVAICKVRLISDTTLKIAISNGNSLPSFSNLPHFIHCSKQGADVNKSATIVGKFENINSSELISEVFTDNTDQAGLASNVRHTIDGISYTVTKPSRYRIDISSTMKSNNLGYFKVDVTVNGIVVSQNVTANKGDGNWISATNFYTGNLNVGDVVTLTLLFNTGSTETVGLSYMSVQELPDTSSIVKNLLAESSQTKCQTKYLSANITADGTSDSTDPNYIPALASIEFNNLTVGKKYEIKVYLRAGNAASFDNILLRYKNNGVIIVSPVTSGQVSSSTSAYDLSIFTAQSSTIFAETVSISAGNYIQGGGNDESLTHVILCQLPDTYVDTEEF